MTRDLASCLPLHLKVCDIQWERQKRRTFPAILNKLSYIKQHLQGPFIMYDMTYGLVYTHLIFKEWWHKHGEAKGTDIHALLNYYLSTIKHNLPATSQLKHIWHDIRRCNSSPALKGWSHTVGEAKRKGLPYSSQSSTIKHALLSYNQLLPTWSKALYIPTLLYHVGDIQFERTSLAPLNYLSTIKHNLPATYRLKYFWHDIRRCT